jgi:hypothetical protein
MVNVRWFLRINVKDGVIFWDVDFKEFITMKNTNLLKRLLVAAMVTIAILLVAALTVSAQTQDQTVSNQEQLVKAESTSETGVEAKTAQPMPVFTGYRGIQIGMSADDVRQKVDHLKEKGDAQDFFVFSDVETAQVFYDKSGKVRAVSVDYMGTVSNAPSAQEVLGEELQPKADGSMYDLRRYPAAGYWVSYNRTAGDSPTVTITMQRMS